MLYRVACLCLITLLVACGQRAEGPVVKTLQGEVQGFAGDGVQLFYGIPYATPPVGPLRWQPPHAPSPWQGVRMAITAGPQCFQYMLYLQRGVEDCLYLNVATPDVKPAVPKPVMVWIHGGGFIGGDGLQATPIGRLAERGDVVVVSMNYRLGALGFLAHPALSDESARGNGVRASGNYGLMDQQAVLRWVRDNIAAFGGDPANVTVFGESAGGVSVCAHLTSPGSAELFHRAIVQSGPCVSRNPSLLAAERQGEYLAIKAGCEGRGDLLACLRSKTPEEILDALPNDPAFVFGEGEYGFWIPPVDGRVLPESIGSAFASGRFNRVPVINGYNGDEGSIMVMFSHEYRFAPLQAADYEKRIRYLVGDNPAVVDALKARYPLAQYDDPGAALAALFGDGFMACNVRRATALLSQWVPVHAYAFTYPDARFILPELRALNAFHGAELQFLFDAPMNWFQRRFSGEGRTLSDAIIHYWAAFARSGTPAVDGLPAWPAAGTDGQLLLLDRQLAFGEGPGREACDFWQQLPVPERNGLAHFEQQSR